jgi:tetratricopeptide (TPR) repeat protein
LGEAFFHLGDLDKTTHCFTEALNRNPELHDVRMNLGIALQNSGKHEAAVAELRKALAAMPLHPEGPNALATSLHELGRTHQAIDVLKEAAQRHAKSGKILSNLGVLYEKSDKLEDAIEWYTKSLEVAPNESQSLFNRGSSLIQLLRIDEARKDWQAALALDHKPGNVSKDTVACNLAILEMLDGNLIEGFELFETRWGVRHQKFPIPHPEWAGQDLAGKHILLYVEQGLGDMLQFCRYAGVLKQKYGCRITLAALPALQRLLRSCDGVDAVVDIKPPYPPADYQLSLLSVPRVLKTTLQSIPARVPYLHAEPALVGKWRDRLGGKTESRRIGLFWQGTQVDTNRIIRLNDLRALWEVKGCEFVSLQKGAGEEEIGKFDLPLTAVGHELSDYADTAAVLENLDLLITIDTSIAHAAGALARPVWAMIPYRPDWRWFLRRTDSPFYPTMRLFRQQARKEWIGTIAEVVAALAAHQR